MRLTRPWRLHAVNDVGATNPAGPKDRVAHGRLVTEDAGILGTDGYPSYPTKVGDHFTLGIVGSLLT
jgi:hypothetical protein